MTASNTVAQTILFLAANPKDTAPLRIDQELRDIGEGLQRSQNRDRFNLKQRSAVRPRDIQRAMLDVRPQIIHFSGHGAGETGLVFEDEVGNSKLVNGDALAALFKLFADQLNCVVLNGCYSEVQAQAIAQHIPYVIGMSKAIGNKAAIAFAVGFYDALGAGRDVEFAFEFGCAAIGLEDIREHLTPVLIGKPIAPGDVVQSNPIPLTAAGQFVENLPESKIRYEFVLSGSIQEINKHRIDAVISHLQKLIEDSSLTLIEVESGSIKLILEGSFDGFERLSRLIEAGELREVLGIPIQGLEIISSANAPNSMTKKLIIVEDTAQVNPTLTISPMIQVNMELSGNQRKQLREALQSAFPERFRLDLLLREEMDINLDAVVANGSLAETVAGLITFAESRGRLVELVTAANRCNPGNPKLRLFAESVGILASDFKSVTSSTDMVGVLSTLTRNGPDPKTSIPALVKLEPIEIFISYSHKDDSLREELVAHLSNLRRQGKISAWHDRAIEAGSEWGTQIKAKLESARIILLLVSPPFMASSYCYDLEMERAIQRHNEGTARVIPIILRPVDWRDTPFNKLQVLPKDAKPVTQWDNQDTAFVDVVQGIRRAVDSLANS